MNQRPPGEPFELWGAQPYFTFDIVGESRYRDAIFQLHRQSSHRTGSEAFTQVWLVPEPDNRFDPYAVAVKGPTGKLGYLAKEVAPLYGPELTDLHSRGQVGVVEARIYAGFDHQQRRVGSVRLNLGQPGRLVPANDPPDEPYVVLMPAPSKGKVSVDDTAPVALYQRPGSGRTVYSTLSVDASGRGKPRIIVSVDGQRVGRLSAQTSTAVIPLLERLEEAGRTVVGAAHVVGNRMATEIYVSVIKAVDVTDRWLEEALTDRPVKAQAEGTAEVEQVEDYTTADPMERQRFPVAGWYNDPRGKADLRYWDGNTWTEHLHNY